jgi:3'-phosphoadenosine 5'-phosphosulfate (PAPS) 3'-phosphatase
MPQCSAQGHPLLHPDYADDLKRALLAVRTASKACMKVQRELHAAQVVSKDDSSPVTIADYAAQAIVAWVLQRGTRSRFDPRTHI